MRISWGDLNTPLRQGLCGWDRGIQAAKVPQVILMCIQGRQHWLELLAGNDGPERHGQVGVVRGLVVSLTGRLDPRKPSRVRLWETLQTRPSLLLPLLRPRT